MASSLLKTIKKYLCGIRRPPHLSDLEDIRRRLEMLECRMAREYKTEENGTDADGFYFAFENRFRGSAETIHEKLACYLPRLQRLRSLSVRGDFLDIGCGRGDWLELLAGKGIPARGIDVNTCMVEAVRERGLRAEQADILPYLRDLPSSSLSGFSAFHVVEHLPVPALLEMMRAAWRLLAPNGLLIVETPNPENPIVGSCDFWIDPTHRRPVPPTLLTHLVAYAGFGNAECIRVPSRTVEFPENDSAEIKDTALRATAERMRIERDYAVIATKIT